MRLIRRAALAVAAVCAFGLTASAADMTAFDVAKEGNRFVSEDAKDRVVQIRSEKSVGTLVPNIWFVLYFDPDASTKITEVKFGAGQKLHVKRPIRGFYIGPHDEMDRARLKVDSDKAIDIALNEEMIKNLKITATKLKLEDWKDYGGPGWKVELWAAKIREPNKEVSIGEMIISAESGKVVKNDLKIGRVD